jgi:uncharacterized protein
MKKIILLSVLVILTMSSNSLFAQKANYNKIVPGSWSGKLSADGMDLRVVFNLKLTGKDSLSATLDSPDQNAKDIPCGKVTLEKEKLVILAPMINGEYNGVITGDSTMTGTWSQNGGTLPLNLKKQK